MEAPHPGRAPEEVEPRQPALAHERGKCVFRGREMVATTHARREQVAHGCRAGAPGASPVDARSPPWDRADAFDELPAIDEEQPRRHSSQAERGPRGRLALGNLAAPAKHPVYHALRELAIGGRWAGQRVAEEQLPPPPQDNGWPSP